MNEKQFDLYGEDSRKASPNPTEPSSNVVSDSIVLYLDPTKPLPQLIEPVRNLLDDKPDNFNFSLYIVSGKEIHQDFELFANYLKGLMTNGHEIRFYFRGILHYPFIPLLVLDSTFVAETCKFHYSPKILHFLLKNLLAEKGLAEKFMQRFVHDYKDYDFDLYLNLNELEIIGFNLKKF